MKVLLVEDHSAMRFGVRTLLEFVERMKVVGEAEEATEALRLAQKERPDVVILDMRLKGEQNGIEVCREIKSLPDPPRVLIYTAFNSTEDVSSAFLSGADGYVHKSVDYRQLSTAVRRICSGQHVRLLGEGIEEGELRLNTIPNDCSLTSREKKSTLYCSGDTPTPRSPKSSVSDSPRSKPT